MELTELKDKILAASSINKQELESILAVIEEDSALFPFNEYEYLICNLLKQNSLTFSQYLASWL